MSNCCPDSLNNGQSSRQGSTGSSKENAPNKPKKVPHYLRASTGSCHDMCKNGGQHEKETRKPLRKIWPKSSTNVVKSAEMAVPGKPKLHKVINRKTTVSHVSLTAPFNTASSKARENGRLKSSSPLNEIEASNSKDSDKPLHIIKTAMDPNANANASLSSSLLPLSSPHSTSTLSPDKDDQVIKHCQPVKDTSNQASRKCQAVVSKNSPPNSFRNQKEAHNRPSRLRFRTAKILAAENGTKPAGGRDDPGLIPCLKVKLKHQEVQRKEERQGLFNSVIEETANKLVSSRRSKVKALVGAFEAVISLQEGNYTCLHNL